MKTLDYNYVEYLSTPRYSVALNKSSKTTIPIKKITNSNISRKFQR